MPTAISALQLNGRTGGEAEELRILQQVNDWLEDGIGQASERRDLAGLLRHARDRALLLMLFWRQVGADELCRLQLEDMAISAPEGLSCQLSGANAVRRVNWHPLAVPALMPLCPVAAVQLWLSVSGLRSGPLFRRIGHRGEVGDEAMRPDGVFPLLLDLVSQSHSDACDACDEPRAGRGRCSAGRHANVTNN